MVFYNRLDFFHPQSSNQLIATKSELPWPGYRPKKKYLSTPNANRPQNLVRTASVAMALASPTEANKLNDTVTQLRLGGHGTYQY